jgi:exosortase
MGSVSLTRVGLVTLATGGVVGCAWAHAPALAELGRRWATDPQYSHGYLVPLLSVVFLVLRRDRLSAVRPTVSWVGLPLLAVGAGVSATGGLLANDALMAAAILPTVGGLFGLFGGRPGLGWAWPAVLYLGFMVPLPYSLETALSVPLRSLATSGSTWLLQAVGRPAVAEGNVITLETGRVAVAEACSGLSMFLTFFALAVVVVAVVRPPLVDAVVVLVTVPVTSVVVNVLRITANGVAVDLYGPERANEWFHDQAGWVMMPVAIALLFGQLWVLRRAFPPAEGNRPA